MATRSWGEIGQGIEHDGNVVAPGWQIVPIHVGGRGPKQHTPLAVRAGHQCRLPIGIRQDDFDGGGVGITDFLTLLAAWGPC